MPLITRCNDTVGPHTVTQGIWPKPVAPGTQGADGCSLTLSLLERVKVDRTGVTAMEYGVIATGIVIVVATAAASLGSKVSTLFSSIGAKL